MQYVLEYISGFEGTAAPYPTAAMGAKISTLTRGYAAVLSDQSADSNLANLHYIKPFIVAKGY
jgi:hypothetical protein